MDPGKALSVYDGRKWPVVKCGAVYVTDEDKTKTVTKNVISLSSASEEKKKQKSSKYTVAIGSSFGHVHTFLKDSDPVLKTYEKTKAEDKCLLLIRKPKSASKQMLKAYSWADVNVDVQLRQPDGSVKQDPYKVFKDKIKKRTDLTLPPDESGPLRAPIASEKPFYRSRSSVEESRLSSVEESKEENRNNSVFQIDVHGSKPNLSNSYPYIRKGPKLLSQSVADLSETGREINNNKSMGGALSQDHTQDQTLKGQGHTRPNGPPPDVPKMATHGVHKPGFSSESNGTILNVPNEVSHSQISNRPDLLSNVHLRQNSAGEVMEPRNAGSANSRIKHDSGFHSEAPLSSDETYDGGFKQELVHNSSATGNLTSSPKGLRKHQKVAGSHLVPQDSSGPCEQHNRSSQPGVIHSQTNGFSNQTIGVNKQGGFTEFNGQNVGYKNYNTNNHRMAQFPEPQVPQTVKTKHVVRQKSAGSDDCSQSIDPSSPAYQQRNNHQNYESNKNNYPVGQMRNHPQERKQTKSNSPKERVQPQEPSYSKGDKRSRNQNMKPVARQGSDLRQRKSLGDVQEHSVLMFDKEEPVVKTQSLGDLSTGCTFSLVGQKKSDNSVNNESLEFTGTQLMKHIRNYKEMKQSGNGGSLPFRGKTVDDMASVNQYYGKTQSYPTQGGHMSQGKMKHYSSLQHLPTTAETTSKMPQGQGHSIRHREKTPMKPRRSLPQVPGDVQEKKRQITDMVKTRMSVDSSSTSPSSGNSNRGESIEPRPGGISATPSVSDREVSELLLGKKNDFMYSTPGVKNQCNSLNKNPASYMHVPPNYSDSLNVNALRKSGSFGTHDQGVVLAPGGRLSESGQTTLTSQSTIDSGYLTNDPDPETLSTSNYARSIKQSAQSIYTSSKLYKSSKGDHHPRKNSNTKGDHSQTIPGNQCTALPTKPNPAGSVYSAKPVAQNLHGNQSYSGPPSLPISEINKYTVKQVKESHTRNWVESHSSNYMSEHLKESVNSQQPSQTDSGLTTDSRDKNNNRSNKSAIIPENNVTELDLTQSVPPPKPARVYEQKQQLMHHKSELSSKDIERMNNDSGQFSYRSKGKSISMAQGLNEIGCGNNTSTESGRSLLKSQPKFTGSLKDLIGADKQIVPIETLRLESSHSTSTLPGSWKFQAQTRPESSLKFFGKPSLFQLLQTYNLYAVRVRIPERFKIMENVRLVECEVVLPTPWIYGKDASSPLSPKGSYAKLGGPNSAFRPVSATSMSPIKSVSMVTIMDTSEELKNLIESGQLQKGDLIIEVNERLMMGEDLPSLISILQSCQGELLLTVARDTARDSLGNRERNASSPTDEDFRRMEQKINELTTELRKKDRTLKQLNALLPWKLPSAKGSNSPDGKEQEGFVCSLSEDEFIV